MKALVLDASVGVKLFVLEAGTSEAVRLVSAAERVCWPSLLLAEMVGSIIVRLRSDGFDPTAIKDAIMEVQELLQRDGFERTDASLLFKEAVHLAIETTARLADCHYIVLARRLQLPLLTADGRQAAVARSCGVEVCLLETVAP